MEELVNSKCLKAQSLSSQFWCLCVIQPQYLCRRLWEDGAEENSEGSVEDRPEQPGEDHRPASEQRQPREYSPDPRSNLNLYYRVFHS